METKIFNLPESTSRTQTHVITIPSLKSISKITANTGAVTIDKVEGDKVTISVTNGTYSRRVQTGGSYTPSGSKTVSVSVGTANRSTGDYLGNSDGRFYSYNYNSGGYSGNLSVSWTLTSSTEILSNNWVYTYSGNASGTVSRPASDTRTYNYYYKYDVIIEYLENSIPLTTDNTENNKVFYEGDTITLNGSVTDSDNGNIMSVKYKVNNGTTRAIATGISDGTNPLNYSKILKYTLGTLKDGDTVIASGLVDGQQYKITIWAEDDQGGKSEEAVRNFTVVPNRAPVLSIDPIMNQTNKINSEKITISGTVTDADGNDITVDLKVNNDASVQIYSGVPSDFLYDIKIADLVEGENTITVTSKDTFDFVTTKVIKLNKARNAVPLKKAIARYKVNPPTGSAKEILTWIQKEVGGLTVDANVSMVLQGESEQYVPMNKLTAPINDFLEEDEFTYQAIEEKDNITLKLKLSKESAESKQSIKQISGVLG